MTNYCKLIIIIALLPIVLYSLSSESEAKRKNAMKTEFVIPQSGDSINDELVMKIHVSINEIKADDNTSSWRVEYHACGKKVAEGDSIEKVIRVPTSDFDEGRCLVVVNVMDEKYNLGIATRYVTIVK